MDMEVERRYIGFIDSLSVGYINDVLFQKHRLEVVVEDGKASKIAKGRNTKVETESPKMIRKQKMKCKKEME